MKLMHRLFSNSPHGRKDYTLNFFYERAIGTRAAQLACPFVSDVSPLQILKDAGCGRIQLLVRLCTATSPASLKQAREIDDVHVRFFTSDAFHAKFYILAGVALIGSANLTGSGLRSNRELSIAIRADEEDFDEIPTLFDELWNRASVLTDVALTRFATWHRERGSARESDHIDGIDDVSPETVRVESRKSSVERTYLESFRQIYVETLIPSYRTVRSIYGSIGRHPNFDSHNFEYEIDRFLSWTKLTFTTDDKLDENPLRESADLEENIAHYIQRWFATSQPIDDVRITRLRELSSIFASEAELRNTDFGRLTDALLGCAAFDEQLRFTKGGQIVLVKEFQEDNSLEQVRSNFSHLAFGADDFVKRAYDCIYSSNLRLRHFGRSSVLELFGWVNSQSIPPLNMRAVKALRFLGFDVKC